MRLMRLLVVVVIAVGCQRPPAGVESAPQPGSSESDAASAELRRVIEAYREAHVANDVSAIASFWTDDIVLLFSRQPESVRGKAALEASARRSFAENRGTAFEWNIEETGVSGDLAYALIALHEEYVNSLRGETHSMRGRLLYVFRREADSAWKVARGVSVNDEWTTKTQ